ncbi:MAG: TRAP transporter substrate-binding protein DctP [Deltaproteobacteria bacterium]|nr:TRAP transporter substrate-binding protein DctP [Deltaproteobacteria bacterium]
MSLSKTLGPLLGALLATAGLTATLDASAKELSLGTLAPKKSPWGKVFSKWADKVSKKTNGAVTLNWYYNGQQGDEKAMVAKMRAGQLDGAAVTSVGLSAIHKPILAFQMPGLFGDWGKLDAAREQLMPELKDAFKKEGFALLGSGDVGLAHTMSKGKPIRSPNDLKSMKVYAWSDDPVAPVTASVIGYTPVPSSVPELLPKLSSGAINVATVPSLPAVTLQWQQHLDHINEDVVGVGVGGLVMSQKALDSLNADEAEVVRKSGKKAGKKLTKKIREEDAAAFAKIKERMTLVKLSDDERKVWMDTFKKIRSQLAQGTFSPDLVRRLEDMAGR